MIDLQHIEKLHKELEQASPQSSALWIALRKSQIKRVTAEIEIAEAMSSALMALIETLPEGSDEAEELAGAYNNCEQELYRLGRELAHHKRILDNWILPASTKQD